MIAHARGRTTLHCVPKGTEHRFCVAASVFHRLEPFGALQHLWQCAGGCARNPQSASFHPLPQAPYSWKAFPAAILFTITPSQRSPVDFMKTYPRGFP